MSDALPGNNGASDHCAAVRFDFHVHTPVSRCYSEDDVRPAQIVSAAIDAGAEAIVVNDHHSASALDDMRDAARGTTLTLFPAVEITTRQGHLVALFDPPTSSQVIWDLLRDLDVPRREHGNGHYMITPSIVTAIEGIVAATGLPIPAHIDRWPNGFMEARIERLERRFIHEHPNVVALEITLPHTQDIWQRGGVPGFARRLACIQGSDAHALREIGRRQTAVRTGELSVAGLRTAFEQVDDVTHLMEWQ